MAQIGYRIFSSFSGQRGLTCADHENGTEMFTHWAGVTMNGSVQRYGIDIWRIVVVVRAELPGRLFLPIRGSLLACLCPRRVILARLPVCHPSQHPYALRPRYAHSTYALSLQRNHFCLTGLKGLIKPRPFLGTMSRAYALAPRLLPPAVREYFCHRADTPQARACNS